MKRNIVVSLAIAMALLCTGEVANAEGTIQGMLGVTLTIGAGCFVGGGNSSGSVNDFGSISFGTYSSLANSIDARATGAGGALSLTCTNGTDFTVALDNGRHVTSDNQRRMASTAGAFISYNLYQDAGRTTIWGSGAKALAGTGTGASVPLIVYARVPAAGSTPAANTYNDTVTMTVAW
ncbi:spore coat protein U domain-containing protein [Salmonella enterica subsp. enterica]|nr:spore coat protein U domain-containing protein [Salmonella enterica]EBY0806345.1 SCPU domain-containing protein [Salmonella enterica subsp. enterica serovar Berlin]ECF3780400.1 SCPU domain-containing protein [Salmonella enterica subsp. enterica serovar Oslo]EDR2105581.1 spore coat protein U domain-containing protein [Salmonella enterica subsp. enterica]EDW0612947.1 spore coat protein U domain-containing protein [Salmonella enterica subsp. enterica serovar Ball]EGZ4377858.1 spore coat protei